MLVLNDPAAQLSSVDALNASANGGGPAAAAAVPVADLSAFASSNDIAVKVRRVGLLFCCRLCWNTTS